MKITKEEKILNSLFNHEIRNYYIGSGRYTKRSADYVKQAIDILKKSGLKPTIHYVDDNDAPRNGWCGNYIKLTARGKRLKIVKDAVAKVDAAQKKEDALRNAKNHQTNIKRLPMACHERLYGNLSNNQKKRLNSEIRFLASELYLSIPENGFMEFVQNQLSD